MTNDVCWVTGASGFIGQHLVRMLTEHGFHVIGFTRRPLPSRAQYSCLHGPLNLEIMQHAIASFGQPRRIYHLAGGSTVGQSVADPYGDFVSNVSTTTSVFNAVNNFKLDSSIVIASSAAVYGAGHDVPIRVGAALRPESPYGYHKMMAELIAQYHSQSYAISSTVLRLFSVYGSGIRKQMLYDLCTRLNADEPQVALGGTGSELRDWCNVSDVVKAMIDIPDPAQGKTQTFNIGTGIGTSNRDVGQCVLDCWGDSRELVFTGHIRKGDPFNLVADSNSVIPCFKPQVSLGSGISQFVDWFKQHSRSAR